jgi:endoglucanase
VAVAGRRTRVGVLIAALVVLLAVLAGVAVYAGFAPRPLSANPLTGVTLFDDPDSDAARAARTDPAMDAIAGRPAAIWLMPEQHDASAVGPYVEHLVAEARRTGAWPVFVVSGVPRRDCTADPAGGTADDHAYRTWIGRIADALTAQTVVVLEPGILERVRVCRDRAARIAQLRIAIPLLRASGAVVYLDGGGSADGTAATAMAALLRAAGAAAVRGFASNVGGFATTAADRAYDDRLSSMLGGAHYVIDTSRNGAGPAPDGSTCNPSGRLLGARPRVVEDGTRLDATLWIKNPGDSDGTCHGGPPVGQWWPDGAKALISGGD